MGGTSSSSTHCLNKEITMADLLEKQAKVDEKLECEQATFAVTPLVVYLQKKVFQ